MLKDVCCLDTSEPVFLEGRFNAVIETIQNIALLHFSYNKSIASVDFPKLF
jgi:hypothetical protein